MKPLILVTGGKALLGLSPSFASFQEMLFPVSCASATLGTFHLLELCAPSGPKDCGLAPCVRNALLLTPLNLLAPSLFRSLEPPA